MHPYEAETTGARARLSGRLWPLVAGAAIGLAGLGFGLHHNNRADRIEQTQVAASRALADMQSQMQRMTDRISQQEEKEKAAAALSTQAVDAQRPSPFRQIPASSAPTRGRTNLRTTAKRTPVDPRVLQLEKKFSEHDEKLASTQRLVEDTRTDLENKLSSKSDELSGSIARTSEEVAALRRRGERDYIEFDLVKSKQTQRVGPISLGLRKADVKRKRYDLDMIVDDNRLQKKSVNLLEPLYVTIPDKPQPLELVVNQVTKDRVAGYISVPKYKRSELSAAEPGRKVLTPRSTPVDSRER